MEYEIGISSPDELHTPVMICDAKGIVIYKNDAAVKEVCLPKRRTHVQPHLHPSDAERFTDMAGGKRTAILSVDTGKGKMRAFASPYIRQEKPCVLFVFPAAVQVYSKTKYTRSIEDAMIECADDICDVIKAIDEKSFCIGEKKKLSIDRRIKKKLDDIISYMFLGADNTSYRLNNGVAMIADAIEQTFRNFGFDIRIDCAGLLTNTDRELYIDIGSFIVFFFHLTAFFIECGSDRTMNVSFALSDVGDLSENDRKLEVKLVLSMPYPPFYTDKETDLMKLSELSPSSFLDILLFERFAAAYNYKLGFSINDDHMNNLAVFAEIPLIKKSVVSEPEYGLGDVGYSMDARLLESDLVFMLTSMCLHRGYKYRKKKSN